MAIAENTVGVPHTLVIYVVSGGVYVTTVAAAVPKVIPVVAVPPESVVTVDSPFSYHVVTNVSDVGVTLLLTAAVTCT